MKNGCVSLLSFVSRLVRPHMYTERCRLASRIDRMKTQYDHTFTDSFRYRANNDDPWNTVTVWVSSIRNLNQFALASQLSYKAARGALLSKRNLTMANHISTGRIAHFEFLLHVVYFPLLLWDCVYDLPTKVTVCKQINLLGAGRKLFPWQSRSE